MTINKSPFISLNSKNGDISLHCPKTLPNATGYLWNRKMLLNMSCRGFANTHFMQPEPATYSTGPALEAKTFMQPEHQYYQGHPGRFFYVWDHQSQQAFSLPYEPMCQTLDKFEFVVSEQHIRWDIEHRGWHFELQVNLSKEDVVELWQLQVTNLRNDKRKLSIYPCFNIGYQSWMNQGADFDSDLNGIIGTKISPYQKLEDYPKQKNYKELSFLCASETPTSWTTSLSGFLGDGGWSMPDCIVDNTLPKTAARYETPVAVMQFESDFTNEQKRDWQFIFGAAQHQQEIIQLSQRYLQDLNFNQAKTAYQDYYTSVRSCVKVTTPDKEFDNIVNHWLPRQTFYHGDVNRLTTDPQTRNYLQDAMGMCFINPEVFKKALVTTLSQQEYSGEIPDGILLHKDAELKYINKIPHADHSIWLPVCLEVYLNETNDYALLKEPLGYQDSADIEPVWQHIERAMQWLEGNLDNRGLSLIHQGDWCDPMNMVGHKGKGVSGWLSMASAWAFKLWADVLTHIDNAERAQYWRDTAESLNQKINHYFWDGDWYARGISDDGRTFGTHEDKEGKIFLNPQSWSLLCGAADNGQKQKLLDAVGKHLHSPYGVAMLSPAFTEMVEDIGRVTQKFPGVAENGSLYNHAAAFYLYALYCENSADTGFEVLKQITTSCEQALQKGQLPNFVPNYYRGAWELYPECTGRSSRLFNTGTVAWLMRVIVEQLFGIKGKTNKLVINPKLPSHWHEAQITRVFRGIPLQISYLRKPDLNAPMILHNGGQIQSNEILFSQLSIGDAIEVFLPSGDEKT